MWKQKRQNLYFKEKQRFRRRLFTALTIVLVSLGVFVLAIGARKRPSQKDSPTVVYPGRFTEQKNFRQSVRSVTHSIEKGDSLYQVLVSHGVEIGKVGGLLAACNSLAELQRLRPGELLNLFFSGNSQQLTKVKPCSWGPWLDNQSIRRTAGGYTSSGARHYQRQPLSECDG